MEYQRGFPFVCLLLSLVNRRVKIEGLAQLYFDEYSVNIVDYVGAVLGALELLSTASFKREGFKERYHLTLAALSLLSVELTHARRLCISAPHPTRAVASTYL